jgi:hypothetical protein
MSSRASSGAGKLLEYRDLPTLPCCGVLWAPVQNRCFERFEQAVDPAELVLAAPCSRSQFA